jgi:hypothetical protein
VETVAAVAVDQLLTIEEGRGVTARTAVARGATPPSK